MSLVCDPVTTAAAGSAATLGVQRSPIHKSRGLGSGSQSLEASPNSNMKLAALRFVPQSSLEVNQSDSYTVVSTSFVRKIGRPPILKTNPVVGSGVNW